MQAAATATAATAESAAKASAGRDRGADRSGHHGRPQGAPPRARRRQARVRVGAGLAPAGCAKALRDSPDRRARLLQPLGADDRLTKKQLQKVHRFDGRVVVHAAALRKVQRYQVITRGVDVSQTPTIVVIDRNFRPSC